jgi:hypothetical protein
MSGKFVKGQSGNPNGRPKKDKTIRDRLMTHADEVIDQLLAQCREGNTQACSILLNRITPSLKPATAPTEIPANLFDQSPTLASQAGALFSEATRGELSPDVANSFISSLASIAKIIETSELIERIERLEGLSNDH